MNDKQMEKMMKQMGMETEEIPATRVIIEGENTTYEITQPQVSKITMQGMETFQIQGTLEEKSHSSISEEDVQLVMEKAQVSEEQARAALEQTDDISDAILQLSTE